MDSRKHFATKRKRDAYATIRGFVYQVELTIQRWLDLKDGEALELERGEDVDTIQEAMSGFGNEQSRLLEQIKARVKKLTLRSGSALSALANFYEHDCNNSKLKLSYRYVTNAAVGVERPSGTPDRVPLIALWNELHDNQIYQKDMSARFKQTRAFLAATTKPQKLDAKTWKLFKSFVRRSSDRSFRNFVRRVEWSVTQTATDRVAEQVQKTLVTQYGTEPAEAQTTYERLFLHVFKILSEPGIKRLMTNDRERVLRSPYLNSRDQALLASLTVHLTDLTTRLGALEQVVASLKPSDLPRPSEISSAIKEITKRTANAIIDGQLLIDRVTVAKQLDSFLSSDARYCFVLGPAGVGKSICLAMTAQRLSVDHDVLLMSGKHFSLAGAARLIADELPRASAALSWQNVIQLITSNQGSGILLFIDAIDEADHLNQLTSELSKLHESINAIGQREIRVILSCRDIAWPRFRQQRLTPLYAESETSGGHQSGYSAITIRVGDFTVGELDKALEQVGAVELLSPGRYGAPPTAHVAAVRDLLRHPGTFEHYAALKRTNESLPVGEVTWSYLVRQRLDKSLEKTGRQSGVLPDVLKQMLESVAVLAWREKSKTFEIEFGMLKDSVPGLIEQAHKGNPKPLATLLENRLLVQSNVVGKQLIGFHVADMGAYLLSFELERRIKSKTIEQVRDEFRAWLKDSWDFNSLLDSLLALLDRLVAAQPYGSHCVALVSVLLESHRFRQSSIFGLMHTNVLKTLFEIIKESDEDSFYQCRDAALQVRPSSEVLVEIRSHLKHENSLVRRLAAELAGTHHDVMAIDELIQLLQDPEQDVRQRAYKAFSYLGKPAIDPLLNVVQDALQPVELRSSSVTALRNIGFRSDEVSLALTKCLEQGKHNAELLKNSLYAVAYLRDHDHHKAATEALCHEDEWVAQGGAKYLYEVPDPKAFTPLLKALRAAPLTDEERSRRIWLVNQLIVALWKSDSAKAGPVLTRLVGEALAGKAELLPVRAIELSDKIDSPSIPILILQKLVSVLQQPAPVKFVWRSATALGATWQIEKLRALRDENRRIARKGIDISKLFVDAIIPGIQVSEEFPLGDRLNRVSDLMAVAKCEARNFAIEAVRLFPISGFLTCHELSRLLWINGDTRAEKGLIHKLENPSTENEAKHERFYAVRALGTCAATKRGVDAVLDYLKHNGDDISYYFHRETLYPLLIRTLIKPGQLIKLARDSDAPWAARSVSLLALAITETRAHGPVFAEIARQTADEPRLQETAVRMLGFSNSKSALLELRRFLREGDDLSVREQAAECLAWLNDTASVHEIERALEKSHGRDFVTALATLREQSSLPILLDRLASAPYQWEYDYIRAIGAFWKYPAGRTAILEQFDRWSAPDMAYRDVQSPMIEGLAQYEPDVILEHFPKAFDDGQLNTAARETMGVMMARLFNRKVGSETLMLEVAKRLVCDQHVAARERMCHALSFAKKRFCSRLFEELNASTSNEWERSAAAYSLGFWDSQIAQIQSVRFDAELLVRKSADAALEMRSNKKQLERHLTRFNSGTISERLSSYLCLCEKGDQASIWALHEDKYIDGMARTFRRHLAERIKKRLSDEYQKRQREQKDLTESRGTIAFD